MDSESEIIDNSKDLQIFLMNHILVYDFVKECKLLDKSQEQIDTEFKILQTKIVREYLNMK